MLLVLNNNGIGWAKQINKLIEHYGLERDWEKISSHLVSRWRTLVSKAIEIKNRERLIEMCHGVHGEKTKTKRLLNELMSESYERKALLSIFRKSRIKARAQIMSMFGMLQCANNFKFGYRNSNCNECGVLDDENHRINHCFKLVSFASWIRV